mgnify:CR=1 FL=1
MAEDFFGNLSKTLKKTVDTVGKKTDEFVEIQKIRTRQHALEDQIEKNYQDIGQIIYNRYLNGEAFDENLAGICKDITDLEKEIADCREDVANKRGRIVCPACGASVPKDAAFCMRCGAAMPEKEEEPEDAEFVHVEPEEKAEEKQAEKTAGKEKKHTIVVVSSDRMGSGNDELGKVLIKGFIFAVTQLDELPEQMLFYNGGAVLTCEGADTLEDLKNLEAQGVEILTCGTCLDYYGLKEKLQVGSVPNMYAIVEAMNRADKIIRP